MVHAALRCKTTKNNPSLPNTIELYTIMEMSIAPFQSDGSDNNCHHKQESFSWSDRTNSFEKQRYAHLKKFFKTKLLFVQAPRSRNDCESSSMPLKKLPLCLKEPPRQLFTCNDIR